MTLTRREFLVSGGALAGLGLLAPIVGRGSQVFGLTGADPETAARNRLVLIFQQGGNDGLNTVIPTADVAGADRYSVYRKVRPSIGYTSGTLPLDRVGDADHALALSPKLSTFHNLYRDGRLAVVQGVDYPAHNYSHFESTDIWESGRPELSNDSGWLGRHLDRAGIGEGELRGVGIGSQLPLVLQGRVRQGVGITGIPLRFSDGTAAIGDARHAALRSYGQAMWPEPLRQLAADQAETTVDTVELLEAAPAPPATGSSLANALLTARTLMTQNLGVEIVFVTQPGYDTHTTQVSSQEALLTSLDQAVEAFLFGTMAGVAVGTIGPLDPAVAANTVIMTMSEFGRRIGENAVGAVAGTDHGAAAPLFLIGPPGAGANGASLVPGLHGDHPDMGTAILPADNLAMTTELRRVYQAVLQQWLGDPDPTYEGKYEPLSGLFSTPSVETTTTSSSTSTSSTTSTTVADTTTTTMGTTTTTMDTTTTTMAAAPAAKGKGGPKK